MTTTTNTPVDTLRDGSLKAVIWKNPGKDEKPPRYSVQLTRSYQDEKGDWRETSSFSGSELLRIARLAHIAYDEIQIHRANDRSKEQRAS